MRVNAKARGRIFGRSVVVAQLLMTLASCANETVEPAALALVGGTLLDPGSPAPREGVIVIRDGRLACVGTADQCPPPAGARSLDLRGLFVGPGLIDAHVHYGQTGWVDGRPDAIDLRVVGILRAEVYGPTP